MAKHTIREGDTLAKIARQYGTSVQALISNNDMTDINELYPGKTLKVPEAKAAAPTQPGKAVSSREPVDSRGTYVAPVAAAAPVFEKDFAPKANLVDYMARSKLPEAAPPVRYVNNYGQPIDEHSYDGNTDINKFNRYDYRSTRDMIQGIEPREYMMVDRYGRRRDESNPYGMYSPGSTEMPNQPRGTYYEDDEPKVQKKIPFTPYVEPRETSIVDHLGNRYNGNNPDSPENRSRSYRTPPRMTTMSDEIFRYSLRNFMGNGHGLTKEKEDALIFLINDKEKHPEKYDDFTGFTVDELKKFHFTDIPNYRFFRDNIDLLRTLSMRSDLDASDYTMSGSTFDQIGGFINPKQVAP